MIKHKLAACLALQVVIWNIAFAQDDKLEPANNQSSASDGKQNGTDQKSDSGNDRAAALMNDSSLNTDKPAPTDQSTTNQTQQEESKGGAPAMLIFTGMVAIAAIFQAIFVFYQWSTMRDQHQIMLDQLTQLRLEQRAWVMFEKMTIGPLVAGSPAVTGLTVQNVGKTPAIILRENVDSTALASEAELAEHIEKANQRFNATSVRENNIGPGGIAHFEAPTPWTMPVETLEAMHNTTARLYIIAQLEYLDIFGQTRTTRICYVHDARTNVLWGHNLYNLMT
jgi:hypothetical protein